MEMALVTPFLIAFLYSIFELGWAMQCGSSVREAVQHSSRALISNSELTNEELTTKVNERLDHLPITNLTVAITEEWVAGNAQVGAGDLGLRLHPQLPLGPQHPVPLRLQHRGAAGPGLTSSAPGTASAATLLPKSTSRANAPSAARCAWLCGGLGSYGHGRVGVAPQPMQREAA